MTGPLSPSSTARSAFRSVVAPGRLLIVAAVVAAVAGTSAQAATPTATEFTTGITAGGFPVRITSGPDGNLWFTERDGDRVGKVTPSGTITEVATGGTTAGFTADSEPRGITSGRDGNLWFAENDDVNGNRIARITPAGVVTEFSTGITAGSQPEMIVDAPTDNLWFTEFNVNNGNRIGRSTTAGTVTEVSTGITAQSQPAGIAVGSDGNVWFTEFNPTNGSKVGRITSAGVVTEFSTGITAGSLPNGITPGPDGALWFASQGGRIGRIPTSGTPVTEFTTGISASDQPSHIVAGQDGNLWFTVTGTSRIGRITPAGEVTQFGSANGITAGSGPNGIAAGPDGNIWFTAGLGNRIGRINTALEPPAFQNATSITIPTSGAGTPYPSEIPVSGLQGTVTDVRVRLTGLHHTFPDDIDVLLVGPGGQTALVASDVGGQNTNSGVTLNLSEGGPFALGDVGPLVSGRFTPTNVVDAGSDVFPTTPVAPPVGPYSSDLSTFDGTNPNGTWQLFVRDDIGGDLGAIFGGWGLDIDTTGPPGSGSSGQGGAGSAGGGGTAGAGIGGALAAFGRNTNVSLSAAANGASVKVSNGNSFPVTGAVAGKTAQSFATARRRKLSLSAKRFSLGPRSSKTVKLALPKKARRALKRRRRLGLSLSATVRDPAGNTRKVTKRVTVKLKKKKKRKRKR